MRRLGEPTNTKTLHRAGAVLHRLATCALVAICGCMALHQPEAPGVVPVAYKADPFVVRVVDIRGEAVAGAGVYLHQHDRAVAATRTDIQGYASLDATPGSYCLSLRAEGLAIAAYAIDLDDTVRPTFTLLPEQIVRVRVLTPDGEPVPGVTAVVTGNQKVGRRSLTRTCGLDAATTDAEGIARFAMLYHGEFSVELHDGGVPLVMDSERAGYSATAQSSSAGELLNVYLAPQ